MYFDNYNVNLLKSIMNSRLAFSQKRISKCVVGKIHELFEFWKI